MGRERVLHVDPAVESDENARWTTSNNWFSLGQDTKRTQITAQGFEEVNVSESRQRRHVK